MIFSSEIFIGQLVDTVEVVDEGSDPRATIFHTFREVVRVEHDVEGDPVAYLEDGSAVVPGSAKLSRIPKGSTFLPRNGSELSAILLSASSDPYTLIEYLRGAQRRVSTREAFLSRFRLQHVPILGSVAQIKISGVEA